MLGSVARRLVSLSLLAAAACGGSSQPAPVVDLVARLPRAEVSPGSPYRLWPVAAVPADDPRDEGVFLRIPSGTWIEWRDLPLEGPLTLELRAGAALDAPADEPDRAHLEIEMRFAGGELSRWEQPIRRPAEGGATSLERLAVTTEGHGRLEALRLSVSCDEGEATWPALFSPLLRGSRRTDRLAASPVRVTRTRVDFVARLGAAEIVEQPADRPVSRARLDPLPGVPGRGGPRVGIRLAPRSRVRFELPSDAAGRLRLAVGVDPDEGRDAPPVRLEILADGRRLVERALDPARRIADRGWVEIDVPVASVDGAPSRLEFLLTGGSGGRPWVALAPLALAEMREVDRLSAARAPNVVVLVVDTLRADAVDEENAPNLTALARRGVRFPRARSFTSWTWPSVASLLTGLHPFTHGVHEGSGFRLADEHETLAERLAARGYTTGAFVTNVLLGAADGFDQGFETYVFVPYARARSVDELALRWVDRTPGLARLLWIHYLDPHQPYRPPDPFFDGLEITPEEREVRGRAAGKWRDRDDPDVRFALERERRRYLAEVRYLDREVGALLEGLAARDFLDDAILVLVADHGEEFLEHGLLQHGGHLYAETLDVPLFVVGFGDHALEPRQDDRLVAAAGLPATVLHLLDGAPPSLPRAWPSWFEEGQAPPFLGYTDHGVVEGRKGFCERTSIVLPVEGSLFEAIRTPAAGTAELYDLTHDPRERRDLARSRPDLLARLLARLDRELDRLRRGAADGGSVDEDARRRLQEMGYVGGR